MVSNIQDKHSSAHALVRSVLILDRWIQTHRNRRNGRTTVHGRGRIRKLHVFEVQGQFGQSEPKKTAHAYEADPLTLKPFTAKSAAANEAVTPALYVNVEIGECALLVVSLACNNRPSRVVDRLDRIEAIALPYACEYGSRYRFPISWSPCP
jgi:hypothetical protein